MIDEQIILPFAFMKKGGIYTGQHENMRYRIEKKAVSEEETVLRCSVWKGPFASEVQPEEAVTKKDFPLSNDGRTEGIQWIREQYETREEEWNS